MELSNISLLFYIKYKLAYIPMNFCTTCIRSINFLNLQCPITFGKYKVKRFIRRWLLSIIFFCYALFYILINHGFMKLFKKKKSIVQMWKLNQVLLLGKEHLVFSLEQKCVSRYDFIYCRCKLYWWDENRQTIPRFDEIL